MDERAREGRVAIVTGAAQGIGAAVALRLARDGLAVGVLDLDAERCAATVARIEAAGGRALPLGADVRDEAAVAEAVERAATALGPPAVLVSNAGYAHAVPTLEMPTQAWDADIGVNLRGAFLATRAAIPHMLRGGWGRIVTISSVSALGDEGRVAYASAKAGLIGFTKSLALELGPSGITSNAVAPGFVESAMTARSARRRGEEFEAFKRAAARSIPVRRVGQPDDIAHAVSYLASPGAGFVSGQVLYVAGGPVD